MHYLVAVVNVWLCSIFTSTIEEIFNGFNWGGFQMILFETAMIFNKFYLLFSPYGIVLSKSTIVSKNYESWCKKMEHFKIRFAQRIRLKCMDEMIEQYSLPFTLCIQGSMSQKKLNWYRNWSAACFWGESFIADVIVWQGLKISLHSYWQKCDKNGFTQISVSTIQIIRDCNMLGMKMFFLNP